MDSLELLDLIKGGESDRIEFKSRVPNDDAISRVITSFANSAGGALLLGVADDGQVVGLSDSAIALASVRIRNVTDRLLPVQVRMQHVVVDGLQVLVVHVPAVPEYLRPVRTARGEVFIRQGDQSLRPAQPTTSISSAEPLRPMRLFVAMSFRFEEEPALVDYFEAMKRAAKLTGLPIEVLRVDFEDGDFEVSTKIIERILQCDVMLADFTLNSSNVYFEAGVARGADKHTIRTSRKGTELPFDLRTWKTILYSNATQLEAALVGPLRSAYVASTSA